MTLSRGFLVLLCLLFVCHLAFILGYLPDVPFWDEWDVWYGWKTGFWEWLWKRHNEHTIVPTRLHMALLTFLFGAHPKLLIVTSFLLWGGVLWVWLRLGNWLSPSGVLPAFLVFLLSLLPFDNHISGFHSQFHFVLLFLLLSIPSLFRGPLTKGSTLWAVSFCGAMIISFSTGFLQAVSVVWVSLIYRFIQREKDRDSFRMACIIWFVTHGVAIHWFLGHGSSPIPTVSVFSSGFFVFFQSLLSYGFGFYDSGDLWGILVFAIVVTPLVRLIHRDRTEGKNWALVALAFAILGAIATISYGRASAGRLAGKSSRYGEIALFLIPIAFLSWNRCLCGWKHTRTFLIGFWSFLFLAFLNDWTFRRYSEHAARLKEGIVCLKENRKKGSYDDCSAVYPLSLASHLHRLEESKAAFYENLSN